MVEPYGTPRASGHRSADPLLFTLEALHLTRRLAGCDLLGTECLTCAGGMVGIGGTKTWMWYDIVYSLDMHMCILLCIYIYIHRCMYISIYI